jgi:hypothetical protein
MSQHARGTESTRIGGFAERPYTFVADRSLVAIAGLLVRLDRR